MSEPSDFQRPLRIPDHIPLGVAEPAVALAGEKGSWRLSFLLARPIPERNTLMLYVHGRRNNRIIWPNLQADSPSKPGFLSLRAPSGQALRPIEASDDGGQFAFEVPAGGLNRGDQMTAELAGAVAPTITAPAKFFLLMDMPPGERQVPSTLFGDALQHIAGACLMRVAGNRPTQLQAYAPSHAAAGEQISLLIRPEDDYANVACEEPGDLLVLLDGREIPAARVPVDGSTCCLLTGVVLPEPGVHRLRVEDVSRGLSAVSNPIHCSAQPPARRCLWGMIHAHTEISDGAGSLDSYFTTMRDECGLDFGATGDHDHLSETSEAMWRLTQEAAARYNAPGRFTAFLGYEWAKWRRNGDGDRNVYYLDDGRPLYRSDDECYPTPADLFRALEGETALIIPHHTAEVGNHCDWKDHEPEKERLVEIYSRWGSSERSVHDGNPYPVQGKDPARRDSGEVPVGFVQRALELGWRVGFTGGGDDHLGHPGDQIIAHHKPWDYRAGLMAVWAEANTRQAVWDGMWQRRCCATTGARIIVDFDLGGHPMGSELALSDYPELASSRSLRVSVHGTAPVTSVEIVRNNVDLHAHTADSEDVTFAWTDEDPLADVNLPPALYCPRPFTFYYLRVTQQDGEMAWASPIWILT